jgi:hypothetical protein
VAPTQTNARGFLHWRLSDASPGARSKCFDGPASETLYNLCRREALETGSNTPISCRTLTGRKGPTTTVTGQPRLRSWFASDIPIAD